jgi:hypothetical protein
VHSQNNSMLLELVFLSENNLFSEES